MSTSARQKATKSAKTNETNRVWDEARIELESPARLVPPEAWVGHIPFAFYLVDALRPRTIVELGVHTGNSYCAFVQAVAKLNLQSTCFGVDHWRGDYQAGVYDNSVFQELRAYHDPLYGSFSTLLRMPFDDALLRMADASIDLLHIDGCHTYETVKGDFENWLPKVSSRGVVLLHDVQVHSGDFGVWRLWEEIRKRFPSFSFVHSHGLGVCYVGSEVPSPELGSLLDAATNAKAKQRARQYFARLGGIVHDKLVVSTANVTKASIEARAEAAERRSKEIAAEYTTASHALNLMAEVRADLAHKLDEVNAWAINLDEQRLELIKEIAVKDTNAADAANQIAALEAARADLLQQINETRASETPDLNSLRRRVEKAGQIASLDNDAAKLISDREAIEKQVEEARRQVAQASIQISELEAIRASLKARADHAQTAEASPQIDALKKQIEEQKTNAARAGSQMAALEAGRDELANWLDASNRRAAALDELRLELAAQLQVAEGKIADVTLRLEETKSELLEKLALTTRNLEETRSRLLDSESRAQNAAARAEEEASNAEFLANEIERLRQNLHQLSGQKAVAAHQRNEIRELTARLGKSEQGEALLSEKARALEWEMAELRAKQERIGQLTRYIPAPITRVLKRTILGSQPSSPPVAVGQADRLADIVRKSDLFDAEYYRQRAGPACIDHDPALHYSTIGERLGIPPSEGFNPTYYAERYPDIGATDMCRLVHYVLHGRAEGRRVRPVVEDFPLRPGRFSPNKDTIILVSHEASRTGAPILSLNIGERLREKYNIISIILRGGDIIENFEEMSSHLIQFEADNRNPVEFSYAIRSIQNQQSIRYAIVSSIESRDIVPSLALASIPTVNLLHEFSPYTRPLKNVREALGWMTELVFSTNVTADSFRKEHPGLTQRCVHILPQGPCRIPISILKTESEAERQKLRKAIRPNGVESAFVVLGAGFVHIRKGIDLFIATAAAALRIGSRRPIRFVWIGSGYDPDREVSYSGYLAEQIVRSGLQDHVVVLDQVTDLEPAYTMADVFYLSSRLDPLPNVAIDAAMRRIPVICFEGSTGIADVLQRDSVTAHTVVPHLIPKPLRAGSSKWRTTNPT